MYTQQEMLKKHQLENTALELKQQRERDLIEQQIAVLKQKMQEQEQKVDRHASIAKTETSSPETAKESEITLEAKYEEIKRKLEEAERKSEEYAQQKQELEQLEHKLENLKKDQEIEKAGLEATQKKERFAALEEEKEDKRKKEAEIEQKRAPYKIFFQKSGIQFLGQQRLQIFLAAITIGEERRELIQLGQTFLRAELVSLIQLYTKAKAAKLSQLTVSLNEEKLTNELLNAATLKDVANNLLQEHKLELSPSSPCDDDLIATVPAIFGAIANSYSESDKHALARKLIKNLWKTHLEKLGLISQKLSSQPQPVNTTPGILTIGAPKMPGTAKKEKRSSPSRAMPSSHATSIFFASLPTREAQELTSSTQSHAATTPLSAIAEVNSATSLSSSSATTVTLSKAKTDTQESQDDFTEQKKL